MRFRAWFCESGESWEKAEANCTRLVLLEEVGGGVVVRTGFMTSMGSSSGTFDSPASRRVRRMSLRATRRTFSLSF
jgi:hypothetical protein